MIVGLNRLLQKGEELGLPSSAQAGKKPLLRRMWRQCSPASRLVFRKMLLLAPENGDFKGAEQLNEAQNRGYDQPLLFGSGGAAAHVAIGVDETVLHVDDEKSRFGLWNFKRAHGQRPPSSVSSRCPK